MSNGMEFGGVTDGRISFDYGAKTIRFGIGLEEAEAKQIIEYFQAKVPNLSKK